MAPALDEVVDDLCRHLEIDRPELTDSGFFTLSAGSTQVVLRNGPGARLLEVEAEVGFLTRSAALELAELEGLLKANLAQSLLRDTLVCLGTGEGSRRQGILVKGFHRYDENDTSRLANLISEVAFSAETLKSILHGSGGGRSHRSAERTQEDPGILIFRP